MKNFLRLLSTSIIAVPIGLVVSCGSKGSDVGVTVYTATDPFTATITSGMKSKLSELGYSMSLSDSQNNQSKQMDQMKALIASGVKVLAINMADLKSGAQVIKIAKDANIPLILYNREAKPSEMGSYNKVYYLGPIGADSGKAQAKAIYNDLKSGNVKDRNKDGKLEYKIIGGESGHPDAIARTVFVQSELRKLIKDNGINSDQFATVSAINTNNNGIMKVDSNGRVFVKSGQNDNDIDKILSATVSPDDVSYTGWGADSTAEATIKGIIGQENTRDLDIVMANGDPSAIKAGVYALGATAGYKKWDSNYSSSTRVDYLPIYGVNGGADVRSSIKEGKVAGSVFQDGNAQGIGIAIMINNIIKNKKIDEGLDKNSFDTSELQTAKKAVRPSYVPVTRSDVVNK